MINGTSFILDEQKACRLSGMSVGKLWDFINEIALKNNLIVVKNGEYHAQGKPDDMLYLGTFILDELLNLEWFTKSVVEWSGFYDDGTSDDIIALARSKNLGVWENSPQKRK